MVMDEWELVGESEEKKRRQRKKRNDAFRRKLNAQKLDRRVHTELNLAVAAAVLAWTIAGLRAWM